MLTVCCVWVKGHVPYGVEYVSRLQGMVARNLTRPHRFVCLTDRPKQLPKGVLGIQIPNPRPLYGWWSKVRLFDRSIPLDRRVLYLDLDTLVVGSLDPIVDYPSPFALVPHAGLFIPGHGLQVVKRFNSSVMVWDSGVNWDLFDTWKPDIAAVYHGDQDWIGLTAPDAGQMPLSWFPRISEIGPGPVPSGARVVLAKTPKPREAAKRWSWVNSVWRAA